MLSLSHLLFFSPSFPFSFSFFLHPFLFCLFFLMIFVIILQSLQLGSDFFQLSLIMEEYGQDAEGRRRKGKVSNLKFGWIKILIWVNSNGKSRVLRARGWRRAEANRWWNREEGRWLVMAFVGGDWMAQWLVVAKGSGESDLHFFFEISKLVVIRRGQASWRWLIGCVFY